MKGLAFLIFLSLVGSSMASANDISKDQLFKEKIQSVMRLTPTIYCWQKSDAPAESGMDCTFKLSPKNMKFIDLLEDGSSKADPKVKKGKGMIFL